MGTLRADDSGRYHMYGAGPLNTVPFETTKTKNTTFSTLTTAHHNIGIKKRAT
jgi:hypothetical protein